MECIFKGVKSFTRDGLELHKLALFLVRLQVASLLEAGIYGGLLMIELCVVAFFNWWILNSWYWTAMLWNTGDLG